MSEKLPSSYEQAIGAFNDSDKRLPEFRMPTCHRHFFKGYRWWCRACSHEVERQFEDVCVALWTLQAEATR